MIITLSLGLLITGCGKNETPNPITQTVTRNHKVANRKGEQGCIVDGKMGIKCTSPFANKCKADDGCHVIGSAVVQTYFSGVTTNEQWLGTVAYNNDAFTEYLKQNGILEY